MQERRRDQRSRFIVNPATISIVVVLIALSAGAATASAHFSRPFVRQIARAANPSEKLCTEGEDKEPGSPCLFPESIAVDNADELWVASKNEFAHGLPLLDGFEPSGAFSKSLTLASPAESLAIDRANPTDHFYTGETNNQGRLLIYSETAKLEHKTAIEAAVSSVAVDNSTGGSAGSVYVVNNHETEPDTLFKFDAEGKEANFECKTEACDKYISGNEITGTPGGGEILAFSAGTPNRGLAVDPANGDIYVAISDDNEISGGPPAVYEYAPSGEFIRAVTLSGAPLPPDYSHIGKLNIDGLAVDPSNGDLLVSLVYDAVSGIAGGAVDELDSSGHFLGQLTAAAGQPFHGVFAVASDSHGQIYVVNSSGQSEIGAQEHFRAIDVYASGHFVPALRIAATTGRHGTEAVLNGAVNPEATLTPEPEEYGVSDCHFEYVTEAEFDEKGFTGSGVNDAPCEVPGAAGEISKTNAYTSVHASIASLEAGKTYRYRLSATLAGALGGFAEVSAALAFTAPGRPAVSGAAANEITSTFADVRATVNSLGADTSYRFEYLTEQRFIADGDTFGTASQSTPEVDLGPGGPTGSSPEAVLEHLGGLAPETAYRFRIVAENEAGKATGEAAFTTVPKVSPGLPDGRAYELLTPPDKEGAEDMFAYPGGSEPLGGYEDLEAGVASESGDQFALTTRAAFGPSPASFSNLYVFSRHPVAGDPARAEWSDASLTPPGLGIQTISSADTGELGAIEPSDFSRVAFTDEVGAPDSEAGVASTSLLGPPGGPYTTLHVDQARHTLQPEKGELTRVVGGSSSLGMVVLGSSNHAFAPAAAGLDPEAPALYESTGAGECSATSQNCALIDVKSNGELLSKCGAALGQEQVGKLPDRHGNAHSAVSSDGSRIFFTAPASGTLGIAGLEGEEGCPNVKGENPPQLYLRSEGETIRISRAERGAETGIHYSAEFVGASADGSRVFFLSEGWLTTDHPAVHDPELYEYEVETGTLTRVSRGESNEPAHVFTVPTVSAEGSAVYFTAFAALAPGAEAHPVLSSIEAESTAPINLYRYEAATATTTYIGTVATGDWPENGDCQSKIGLCPNRDYYATPDGRYFLFASHAQLTPEAHNAASSCPYAKHQGGALTCTELYRYDATTGALLCVSCNPSGAVPVSNALITGSEALASASAGPVRAMSDDGAYVFFGTAESLVPQDTNGQPDVYEWHEGHISLLSAGTSGSPSFFLGYSPNAAAHSEVAREGGNVFIGTHAKLVPQAGAEEGNLYDARVCTAEEPCIKPPPTREGLCEGDACAHPAPAPNDPTPASFTFTGPGNLVSELPPPPTVKTTTTKCKSGFVKKKIKKKQQCVKKPKPKKRAKKSSHGKGRA